jgi:hypothetical protein
LEEFNLARQHMPDALVFAINEACSVIDADFVASYHSEKMPLFWTMNRRKEAKFITCGPMGEGLHPFVDYHMDISDSPALGATSAGCAVEMCRRMGIESIVMVGCPINGGGGYFNDGKTDRFDRGHARLGYMGPGGAAGHITALNDYHDCLPEGHGVRSMCGYTAKIFGKPEWAEGYEYGH